MHASQRQERRSVPRMQNIYKVCTAPAGNMTSTNSQSTSESHPPAPAAAAAESAPEDKKPAAQPVSMQQMLEQLKEAQKKDGKISDLEKQIEALKAGMVHSSMKDTENNLEILEPFFKAVVPEGQEDKVREILDGIRAAQEQFVRQNLPCPGSEGTPFANPRNQVIEVMCSAAAMHGKRTEELEAARAQIAELRGSLDERAKIDAIITSGATEVPALGKRGEPEPSSAANMPGMSGGNATECWSQLFSSVGGSRGGAW